MFTWKVHNTRSFIPRKDGQVMVITHRRLLITNAKPLSFQSGQYRVVVTRRRGSLNWTFNEQQMERLPMWQGEGTPVVAFRSTGKWKRLLKRPDMRDVLAQLELWFGTAEAACAIKELLS